MNKQSIAKTAICYFSTEYGEYIVESPLFSSLAGIGETKAEAWRLFHNLLDDAYESYLEGRVPGYSRPGRPAKGGMAFNTDIKPETKKTIKDLAQHFSCSQGEIIDYLAFFHAVRSNEHTDENPPAPNIEALIKDLVHSSIQEALKTKRKRRKTA